MEFLFAGMPRNLWLFQALCKPITQKKPTYEYCVDAAADDAELPSFQG